MGADPKVLELLLKKGANPNLVTDKGDSPLVLLIQSGKSATLDAIKLLVNNGADVNLQKDGLPLSLNEAIIKDRSDIIHALIELGADVNAGDLSTPLVSASRIGTVPIMRLLLDAGAGPNRSCRLGSPIIAAVKKNNLPAAKVLLEAGADPNLCLPVDFRDKEVAGMSAIQIAEKKRLSKMLDLLRAGKPVQKEMSASLTIKDAWTKIIGRLTDSGHAASGTFQLGESSASIAKLSAAIGVSLPQSFVDSLNVHNGQAGEDASWISSPEDHEADVYSLLSVADIEREWKLQKELLDQGEFRRPSTPDKGIQPVWWSEKWIPIAADGGGDFVCIDLAPTDEGVTGQVISYLNDSPRRRRLSESYTAWLSHLARGDE
jgi:cell wall assembly regulator SMI1